MFIKLKRLLQIISSGAIVIALGSLVSRLLGLLRDRLLAHYFGASQLTDAYLTAFRLPDFIFNLLALGALSASFVPWFLKVWHADATTNLQLTTNDIQNLKFKIYNSNSHDSHREAWLLANGVLVISFVGVFILALLGFIFAGPIVSLLAPGFLGEQKDLTISLTRLMLLSPLFFAVSNVFSGVLTARKKFLAISFAPVWYNLGIIFGIVYLYPHFGTMGLAWGVVIGAALHMVNHLVAGIMSGYKFYLGQIWSGAVKKVFMQLIPRAAGLGLQQVLLMVITSAASLAGVGAITAYTWAQNGAWLPVNLFGVSIAVASFPVLSEAIAQNRPEDFIKHLTEKIKKIMFWLLPASAFIFILSEPLVRLVLGTGAFGEGNIVLTAKILAVFALFLVFQGLVPLLARAWYALHNTKIPFLTSLIGFVITLALAYPAVKIYGVISLAYLYGADMFLQAILLWIFLQKKYKFFFKKDLLDFIKLVASAVAVGFTSYYGWLFLGRVDSIINLLASLVLIGLIASAVYILLIFLLRAEEFKIIKKFVK